MHVKSTSEAGWLTPETSEKLRSGCVILEPGKDIGEHVTHDREEIIIILEGKARVFEEGEEPVEVEAGSTIYIGLNKRHNVENVGEGQLKYVYVVGRA